MADETDLDVEETQGEGNSAWSRVWRVLAGVALGIVLLIVAGLIWLDSQSGHRFIAKQISGLELENGMTITVGRIGGSIYSDMTLHDFVLGDPQGDFLAIPEAEIDWRPFAYLFNHIDVRSLSVPLARLDRAPQFKETQSEGPLIPDIDIDIGQLAVGRLEIDPAVTGQRHRVSLAGTAHIADRQVQVSADARALSGPDITGGDRLVLKVDAAPERERLDVSLDLTAPSDGLIAELTGKEAPVRASLRGEGDWNKWDGRFDAYYGNDELAGMLLTARDGTVAARGHVRPGLLMEGTSANMLAQPTDIDLAAKVDGSRADIQSRIDNENFELATTGIVDFGANRFNGFAAEFRLLRPSAIAPGISGQDVVAKVALDGDFSAPAATYDISAARLGFDGTAIVGLRAQGDASTDGDVVLVPVHARAERISGLDAAAGQLLTNIRIDGDLAIQGSRILSDNLAIRSDKIDATAVLVADTSTGLYTGGLNGRVGNYEIASVGRFDVTSDLDLKRDRAGISIEGTVTARSREIFNSTARDFLGGDGLISSNVVYDSEGTVRVSNVQIAAPEFRLTDGSGSYGVDGTMSFEGRGVSDRYGPLALDIDGTVDEPVVIVQAEKPGLGIGLAGLRAELRGTGQGYSFAATGESDFGPLDAELTILSGEGPLTINVDRAEFAGLDFAGRLEQSAAGPFTGTLTANGSGIEGEAQLLAEGEYQRAVIALRAQNAQLPGAAGVTIGRAIIDADVTLYDQPQLQADMQLASFSMNDLDIERARAKLDYQAGSGSAQLLLNGSRYSRFDIAANASMMPDLWRIALRGHAAGVGFRTIEPARIDPSNGEYELLPTRLRLRDGSIQLAGHYGEDLLLQSRIAAVGLDILRPILPELGLGGKVSGSVDFEQQGNAFPSADARLTIADFTRTGLASVSQPVDVKLVGRLLPDGGNMRAIFERRDTAIGHLQVDLRPLGPESGAWQTRLFAAPLQGGMRYNGPASTLFSLAALPDQHLTGAIGIAADFSGQVQSPVLSGVVRANDLTYANDSYGTKLTQMRVRGTFSNDRLEVTELTANAGDGTVSGSGFVSLSSDKGYPVQLDLELENAQLADNQGMATRATGTVSVVNSPEQPALIQGTIRLPETRYRIVRQGSAEVKTLSGIRRKSNEAQLARERKAASEAEMGAVSSVPRDWRLEVDIVADDRVYVSGMGMESEWSADIQLRGTTGDPRVLGGIELIRGTLGFAGRSFELQEGGRLRFNNGDPTNPTLAISAVGEVDGVNISVNLSGSATDPIVSFSSSPSLPQDEIMARILFGNSIGELSAVQAVQLAASVNALRGKGGGLNPLGVLQSAAGIDRLRIVDGDEASGQGTSVAVGKYISNDVYVEIVTDTRGFTATQLEISLTPALSILSQVGSFGTSNVNLQYRKDY